jgi:YgiT-type zinc finger domain-containing protein
MKHLRLNCEKGNMTRGKKDAVIEYRGHRATVRAIDGWHCPECDEIEFAGKEGPRYAEALEKLRLKIDAEEAAELTRIRKKLSGVLRQSRAAESMPFPGMKMEKRDLSPLWSTCFACWTNILS